VEVEAMMERVELTVEAYVAPGTSTIVQGIIEKALFDTGYVEDSVVEVVSAGIPEIPSKPHSMQDAVCVECGDTFRHALHAKNHYNKYHGGLT
jgi:hypothetical protein